MSGAGATPLFIDTGAFFASFVSNAPRHDQARAVMDAIGDDRLHFRPLYTTNYALSELATLMLRKAGHERASATLSWIRDSDAVTILHPDATTFGAICAEFDRYDDQQISFVDHATATLAREHDVEHVFAFDDDFRTLGLSLVPADIDMPDV